jgi:heme o synthase
MIGVICRLVRLRLVMMNGIAAVAGYLLFPKGADVLEVCAVFLGVSLLAAAGSAWNQVMERQCDALMQRTRNRPIPSGDLTVAAAVLIGAGCAVAGSLTLGATGGLIPTLTGILALLWYLAVYTPLKRRTSFALAIGALCGAAPPVIGWTIAGGDPYQFQVVLLAGIMYLWQVPHFWLLQRRHEEDYRRAGFSLFHPSGSGSTIIPLCLVWVAAMIATALMLPAFGIITLHPGVGVAVPVVALVLAISRKRERALFTCLNLFPLLLTMALIVGK